MTAAQLSQLRTPRMRRIAAGLGTPSMLSSSSRSGSVLVHDSERECVRKLMFSVSFSHRHSRHSQLRGLVADFVCHSIRPTSTESCAQTFHRSSPCRSSQPHSDTDTSARTTTPARAAAATEAASVAAETATCQTCAATATSAATTTTAAAAAFSHEILELSVFV